MCLERSFNIIINNHFQSITSNHYDDCDSSTIAIYTIHAMSSPSAVPASKYQGKSQNSGGSSKGTGKTNTGYGSVDSSNKNKNNNDYYTMSAAPSNHIGDIASKGPSQAHSQLSGGRNALKNLLKIKERFYH